MTRISFSLNFEVIKSRVRKSGLSPIIASITMQGERCQFATGKFVPLSDWDKVKQCVKPSAKDSEPINLFLQQLQTRLYELEIELIDKGFCITASLLRDALQGKVSSTKTYTLFTICDSFIADLKESVGVKISKASFYHYDRSIILLKEFVKSKYSRDDFQLHELNYAFISAYDVFIRTQYKQKHNTAIKHVKCIKRIFNDAVRDGIIVINPFASYKTEREVVDRPFLTQDELQRIINKDFLIDRLNRCRDIFIFCCYTGLSYADVKELDNSHISSDDEGRMWIKKHRVKTNVLFRVPLLPVPKMILDKYKGGTKLLPVVDLSSTDAYLKEIATLCGIDKNISFHTARYTFATTITISNNVSLQVVSKMLGHTSTKMSEHYAKVVDTYIAKEMDDLEKSLSKK